MNEKLMKLEEKKYKAVERLDKLIKTLERHERILKNKSEDDYFGIKSKEREIEACIKKINNQQKIVNDIVTILEEERKKWDCITAQCTSKIRDFLNKWESLAIEWHMKKYEEAKKGGVGSLNHVGLIVSNMIRFNNDDKARKFLTEEIKKEKERKVYDLISRINEEAGTIENASNLTIDINGNMNGIIVGSKKTVSVNTVIAGGWNIQCFHYRTLINIVK